jgi:diguanylate cyclase (GGDEF)-like protein/PAS domain S-box-containing protein
MNGSNIGFYWFSAAGEAAPPPLVALGVGTDPPQPDRDGGSVVFVSPVNIHQSRFISEIAAVTGPLAYRVLVLASTRGVELADLPEAIDDICARQELEQGSWFAERAARYAQRKFIAVSQACRQAKIDLQESEQRYRDVFDNAACAIHLIDVMPGRTFKVAARNPAADRATGLMGERFAGGAAEAGGLIEAQPIVDRLSQCADSKQPVSYEQRIALPDGERRYAIRLVPIGRGRGPVHRIMAVGQDVTRGREPEVLREECSQAEEQLRQREREFRTLVENSPDFLIRYDRRGEPLYANPAARQQFAHGEGLLAHAARPPHFVLDSDNYLTQLQESLQYGVKREGEFGYFDSEGDVRTGHFCIVPEFDESGAVCSALAIARDITEIVESRKKIQRLAFYDSLTGLPNRALLHDRIRQLAEDANRLGQQFGLMMLDLDRFKEVNDTMGHAVGDALLRDAVARLRTCVRATDVVARLGGDEFAVLLPGLRRKIDFGVIAAKILRALAEPFHIAGKEINISGSVGIAKYPKDSSEVEVLFKQADAAMYHAKRLGRNNFQFYAPEMMERTIQRMMVETTLRKALPGAELELYYQPRVLLSSGKLLGAEALLRWNHPELGFLTPSKFIGIAEDTGSIIEIGRWVLFEACRKAVEWNTRRSSPIKLSVNLSTRQFVMNDMVTSVREALAETGCRPEWVELEITESLLLEDNESVRATLEELSRAGLTIAMDDFGIGYSALGYLTRYPIDTLKIDRSFIHEIETDRKKRELVKAIIGIARALEMQLVAEGVETQAQADLLMANGCEIAQGYLHGRPMSQSAFADYLRASAMQNPFVRHAKRVVLRD